MSINQQIQHVKMSVAVAVAGPGPGPVICRSTGRVRDDQTCIDGVAERGLENIQIGHQISTGAGTYVHTRTDEGTDQVL